MKKFVVLLAALAMVGLFTTAAIADVSLYGSARFRTYFISDDTDTTPGASSDDDLEWRIGHLTRFGAKFASGDVGGHFELDARQDGSSSVSALEASSGSSGVGHMRLRLNYGWWNFGSGQLMIGQNYPLTDAPVSGLNYGSGGLQAWGGLGFGPARTSQIRLTFGDFRVAFIAPYTAKTVGGALSAYNEVNTTLPKVEVRYDLKVGPAALNFIGGYQTYEIEDLVGTAGTTDIDSYIAAVRAKMNFGAAYVNLALQFRQNGGNYGMWTNAFEDAVVVGTEVYDSEAIAGVIAVGFKASDMVTLEGSYGMIEAEYDTPLGTFEDPVNAFAVICKLTMAPGVYIIPEFVLYDNDEYTTPAGSFEEGDTTVFGVFWRIDYK